MTTVRLGIDFGTTRTVVAVGDRGNYPVVGFVDLAGDPCEWFPSLVAARAGQWRFGFEAQATSAADGWAQLRSFKRCLAQDGAITLGDSTIGVLELTTAYLAALAEALRTRSNLPREQRDAPFEAVIAAPANAHATQRFLTIEAFRRAGFSVVAMLNEPSAAGFEYTHRWGGTLNSRRQHIVVYDLGGGTFDASLIRAQGRHHQVVATAGVSRLGGDDFDEALARLALAAQPGAPALDSLDLAARSRLGERCRQAKEALTPQTRRMHVELDGGHEVTVPVADFYAATAHLVEDSIVALEPVLATGERELADDLVDIAGLYVVGGASALPLVGRALKERFGRRVHRSPYPFAATAIGLAIAADPAAGFSLADQLSRNFGVFREGDEGKSVRFDAIFRRDQPVPGTGSPGETLLRRRYRAMHNVGHYRFAEVAAVDAQGIPSGDLTPLGEVRFAFDPGLRTADLAGVAVERRGDGPRVVERYALGPSGIVELEIADLDTGYSRAFRLH
jgi:molecular chaperone DnaK (HSP70)